MYSIEDPFYLFFNCKIIMFLCLYNILQSLYVLSCSVLTVSHKNYNVKIILNSSCLLTQFSYKFAKIAYN